MCVRAFRGNVIEPPPQELAAPTCQRLSKVASWVELVTGVWRTPLLLPKLRSAARDPVAGSLAEGLLHAPSCAARTSHIRATATRVERASRSLRLGGGVELNPGGKHGSSATVSQFPSAASA